MTHAFTRALTAGLFLAYLIGLSPHLVHHLFDDDTGRPVCPYFAQSQQSPELPTDPPALTRPDQTATVQAPDPGAWLPSTDPTLADSRAPPAAPPSA